MRTITRHPKISRTAHHRTIDGTGRLTLPGSIRTYLDLEHGSVVEVERIGRIIVIKPLGEAHCAACQGTGLGHSIHDLVEASA